MDILNRSCLFAFLVSASSLLDENKLPNVSMTALSPVELGPLARSALAAFLPIGLVTETSLLGDVASSSNLLALALGVDEPGVELENCSGRRQPLTSSPHELCPASGLLLLLSAVYADKQTTTRPRPDALNGGVPDALKQLDGGLTELHAVAGAVERSRGARGNGGRDLVRWLLQLKEAVHEADEVVDEFEYRSLRPDGGKVACLANSSPPLYSSSSP
ncbi:hypothetical protein ACQ4PT_044872 [Festuca glaucescens]